ncbi:MAG: NAD(P)/FAD-dependent oxidoreductase [Anaerolineaceae bacterium]|nr:NAD(P)/FAD-dependent oxidoreductase [Anaerolineaceae bacterium]
MKKKKKIIRILGAGPSGLTAAIVLAQHGYRVIVNEYRENVGSRFNEDYQGLENWSSDDDSLDEISSFGLNLQPCCKPIHSVNIFDPRFRVKEFNAKKPLFYLVKRGTSDDTLDIFLKQQAIDLGVEIKFLSHLDSSVGHHIIATGPKRTDVIATGVTFNHDVRDGVYMILNNHFAPKGYAYCIASDRSVTIATVLYDDFSKAKKCLDKTILKFQQLLEFDKISEIQSWGGYGSFSIPKTANINGQLYVGEAAGFQDFLCGFGIRYAIVSGYLAAISLVTNSNYDQLWKKRLLTSMEASVANRFICTMFGNFGYRILWLMIANSSYPSRFMKWLYSLSPSRRLLFQVHKHLFQK